MARSSSLSRSLVAAILALLFLLSGATARAGSGRFDAASGTWDLIVSLDWEATPAQLADVEERFTQASELLFDVTDGEMRFGSVTIFDGGVGKEFADCDITLGQGGASAPSGPGIFGVSFHLFTDDDIYPGPGQPEADAWQTIVHEFGHYAFNVKDEYAPSGAECVVPTPATACIMDNYKIAAYEDASELCWSGNHDPDGDTGQELIHGQSCWDRLDDIYPTISAPGSGPDEAPPVGWVAPTFEYFDDPLVRVALVLDTSGSMNGPGGVSPGVTRLEDLQTFAAQLIDVMGLDDVELGIVTYSSNATEQQGATLLDDAGDVAASKGSLPASAAGQTSIGRGLIAGRDLLTASAAPGPLVMILMTDGYHNHPPGDPSFEPLAIVPSLVAEGIRVHTLGIGDSTHEELLRQIAKDTGAIYWKANDSFELEPILASLGAVVRGGSVLDPPQQHPLPPGRAHVSTGWTGALGSNLKLQPVLHPVWVEKDNREATFNLGWSEEASALDLYLRTPGGVVVTPAAVASGAVPGMRLFTGPRYASYVVDDAEDGLWGLAVVPRSNPAGTTYAIQPTVLNLRVRGYADGEVVAGPGGPSIRLVAMARDGLAVTRTQVVATMTDPAGSTAAVQMFDDGDPAHGDDFAADGAYSALVGGLAAGDGVYHFEMRFDVDPAAGATVVPGEEPPPTVDNRSFHTVRKFRRSFPVDVRVGPGGPGRDTDGDDHTDRDEGTRDLDCDGLSNDRDRDSDGDGLDDSRDPEPFEDHGCTPGGPTGGLPTRP